MGSTVAANVLHHGTGALNIDGTRIPVSPDDPVNEAVWTSQASVIRPGTAGFVKSHEPGDKRPARPRPLSDYERNSSGDRGHAGTRDGEATGATNMRPGGGSASPIGRWPSNVVLTDPIFDGDYPIEVVGGTREQKGGGNPSFVKAERSSTGITMGGGWQEYETGKVPVDTEGSYSRFFLVPKASRDDREPVIAGQIASAVVKIGQERHKINPMTGRPPVDPPRENTHPTVKPVELMRHLVRLVTPPGGTVLDPFGGSGTTAVAAEQEGFGCILIEREPDYMRVAEARLNGTQRGLGL